MKATISGNPGKSLMKIIVDADSDRVLGMHMVGADGPEIFQVSPSMPTFPRALSQPKYRNLKSISLVTENSLAVVAPLRIICMSADSVTIQMCCTIARD